MKLVLSWMALQNDFREGKVNLDGPNAQLHAHDFYRKEEITKHIILCSEAKSDTRFELLGNALKTEFPRHDIDFQYMGIQDPINLQEIYPKVQNLLSQLKSQYSEILLYISPGTSMMQVAWVMCHQNRIANTRLFQGRKAKDSDSKQQEFFELQIDRLQDINPVMVSRFVNEIPEVDAPDRIFLPIALRRIYSLAGNLASLAFPVRAMIYGQSGSGKEALARYIHEKKSSRKEAPFFAVNVRAIHPETLHSELFGHVQGAFTGATKARVGYFQKANGGTLFLDEIGDISSEMQTALLRVLQEKTIRPLGGNEEVPVDVLVISATHKNLEVEIAEGRFRQDLYYRLAEFELRLPSFSEWEMDDRKILIQKFITTFNKEFNKSIKLSPEVIQKLLHYHFPGNIRELENILKGFLVHQVETIELIHLPERVRDGLTPQYDPFNLEVAKGKHIRSVLSYCQGNKSRAAELLGISRQTIDTYIK